MNPEDQQNLVVLLGGIFIWGVTIGVVIILLKIQMPVPLKFGFGGATIAGVLFTCTYPLIVVSFLSENDIPKLTSMLPGLVILYVSSMLFGFLVLFSRGWSYDRAMKNYKRQMEQEDKKWREEVEAKLKSIDERYKL